MDVNAFDGIHRSLHTMGHELGHHALPKWRYISHRDLHDPKYTKGQYLEGTSDIYGQNLVRSIYPELDKKVITDNMRVRKMSGEDKIHRNLEKRSQILSNPEAYKDHIDKLRELKRLGMPLYEDGLPGSSIKDYK